MAAEFRCFRVKDVVYRLNKKNNIEFGEVVAISRPLESADDHSYGGDPIKEGFVRIKWYRTGEEEVVEENNVGLADRYLAYGEVSRPTKEGRESQLGKCVSARVTACVRVTGTKLVIFNVPREDLLPLEEIESSSLVCLDSWIGNVRKVKSSLTLRTSDGSRCVMKYHDCIRAFPNNFTFYPGQTLCGLLSKLDPALWLHRTDNIERGGTVDESDTVDVTVESSETESLDVKWQWPFSPEDVGGPPETTLSGKDLKRLEVLDAIRPKKLTSGDLKYYTLKEGDTVTTKGGWRHALREAALAGGGRLGPAPFEAALAKTSSGEIETPDAPGENGETRVDSNSSSDDSDPDETPSAGGSRDRKDVSGESLTGDEAVLIKCLNAYFDKRAPGDNMNALAKYASTTYLPSGSGEAKEPMTVADLLQKCVSKTAKLRAAETRGRARREAPAPAPTPGARVVVEVLHTAGRADVVWQDGSTERGVPTTELVERELDWSEPQLHPGDVVREAGRAREGGVYGVVQRADHVGRTAAVRWFGAGDPRPALSADLAEASFYEIEHDPELHHRPSSIVVGVADAEGAKRTAGRVLENLPEGKARVRWADGTVSACRPQHLRRCAFISRAQKDDGSSVSQAQARPRVDVESDDRASLPDIGGGSRSPDDDSASAGPANDGGTFSTAGTAPDDHTFKPNAFRPVDPKLFLETVRGEIAILRASLPAGVRVRGFEDRPDLFSAMIRGPPDTPYEDGLFLFDLQLSKDYPASPPACRYLSRGRGQLNPNLCENGTVCVSLLGTWEGRDKNESWTAGSNLLQVIVSVRGLIAVSEPYFNEPAAASRRGGERSRVYNESAALGAVRSAVELVRRPPTAFRAEIARHFAENARKLCARLEGWLDASERYNGSRQPPTASPGSETLPLQGLLLRGLQELSLQDLGEHDFQVPEFPLIPASKGFCITLRKTLKAFTEALLSAGIAPK